MKDYRELTTIFKAISDPTRLQIIDILSCGRLCACKILESLMISQSTLSHHMKILTECELVKSEKEATWMYYSINRQKIKGLHESIDLLAVDKQKCSCNDLHNKESIGSNICR